MLLKTSLTASFMGVEVGRAFLANVVGKLRALGFGAAHATSLGLHAVSIKRMVMHARVEVLGVTASASVWVLHLVHRSRVFDIFPLQDVHDAR